MLFITFPLLDPIGEFNGTDQKSKTFKIEISFNRTKDHSVDQPLLGRDPYVVELACVFPLLALPNLNDPSVLQRDVFHDFILP